MNIHHLKCFECVYETRSINKAAGRLYMSPQGVGKSIQYLENELDIELFERTKSGVIPTEGALLLHKKAAVIIKQLEELCLSLEQLKHRQSVLRIGYVSGIFNILPFEAIFKFMEENPQIQVTWNEYSNVQIHEMLRDSRIEYGFGIGVKRVDEKPEIVYGKLAKKAGMLLVYEGHPLYGQEQIFLQMLQHEKIITMNEDYFIYHKFLDMCSQAGFCPKVVAKTADSSALFHLCRQRIGLAVLPEYHVKNIELKGVRAIRFAEDFDMVVHSAYKKENENIDVVRKFDRFLKQYI